MAEPTVCGTGLWGNPTKPGDPDNNITLSATAVFGGIRVQWTYPNVNPQGVAFIRLFRGTSGTEAHAVQHAVVNGSTYLDQVDTDVPIQFYYWIEVVSVNGTVAEKIGPATAWAGPISYEDLYGEIDSGKLAQALREKIEHISVVETMLDTEVGNRLNAIESVSQALTALEQNTLGTLDDFNNQLLERIDADALFVDELNQTKTALDGLDADLSTTRDNLSEMQSRLDQRVNDAFSDIGEVRDNLAAEADRLRTRVDEVAQSASQTRSALEAKDDELDQRLRDAETAVVNEVGIRQNEHREVVNRLSGIQADVGENRSYIGQMQRVQAEQDAIEAIQFEAFSAESANRQASIRTQELVRISAEEALAQRSDAIEAKTDANTASITEEVTARTDAISAVTSRIGELSAKLDAAPSFGSGFEAGADMDQWEVPASDTLSSDTSDVYAGLQSALISSTAKNPASSGITGATYAKIPSGATEAFEGYEVVIQIAAKKPSSNASYEFALTYSTASVGNSGWHRFTPTDHWQIYEFRYQVPEGSSGNNDYLGIWADTSGVGRSLLIDAVSIRRANAQIAEISAALEQEQTARVSAIEALTSDFNALKSTVGDNQALLAQEKEARTTEHEAIASDVATMQSRISGAESSITEEMETRASAVQSLSKRASSLESRMSGAESSITEEERARTSDVEALTSSIQGLSAELDGAKSDILSEREARTTALEAVTAELNSQSSHLDDAFSRISSEETTRSTETKALANRASVLETQMKDANAALLAEEETRSTETEALASRATSAEARLDDAEASITEEEKARTTGDEANATRISGVETELRDTAAAITEKQDVLSREDKAQAHALSGMRARLGEAEGMISANSRVLAEQDALEAVQFEALEAVREGSSALVAHERETRVAENEAVAKELSEVSARFEDVDAAITKETNARTSALEGVADQLQLFDTELEDARTLISQETSARVEANKSIAKDIQGLTSEVSDNKAGILSEAETRATEDQAQTRRADNMAVRLSDAEGAIAAEQRLNAEQELLEAIQLEAIEVTKAGATAGIQLERTVRVTENEAFAEELNTIGAELEGTKALILSDYETRADAEKARAVMGQALQTDIDKNRGLIIQEAETSANRDEARGREIDGLYAQFNRSPLWSSGFEPGMDFDRWGSHSSATISLSDDAHSGTKAALVKSTASNPNSGGVTQGARVKIPQPTAQAWAGSRIRITVQAKRPSSEAAAEFAMTYSTNSAGNSGWHRFTPGNSYQKFSWLYDVPAGADGQDWFGIWGDTSGSGKGVLIDTVVIERVSTSEDLPEVMAAIETNRQAVVNAEEALAQNVTNVQSELEGQIANTEQRMETQISTVDGKVTEIGALYTAKVQANGLVGGFGVHNDGTTVEAGFDVDRLWFGRTGPDKVKPFVMDGTNIRFDGLVNFSNVGGANKPNDVQRKVNAIDWTGGTFALAECTNGSATARFRVWEEEAGRHNSVEFTLSVSFGKANLATVTLHSAARYQTKTITDVVLYYSGTYDRMVAAVRVNNLPGKNVDFHVEILDSSGSPGWSMISTRWTDTSGMSQRTWPVDNTLVGAPAEWVRPDSTLIDGNKIYTGDAYVDTLQIKGNAITISAAAYKAQEGSWYYANDGYYNWKPWMSLNGFHQDGASTFVMAMVPYEASDTSQGTNASATAGVKVRIKVDGSVKRSIDVVTTQRTNSNSDGSTAEVNEVGTAVVGYRLPPQNGSRNITLEIVTYRATIKNCYMQAIGVKR